MKFKQNRLRCLLQAYVRSKIESLYKKKMTTRFRGLVMLTRTVMRFSENAFFERFSLSVVKIFIRFL